MGLTSKRPTQTNPENQTKLEEVIGSQVAQSRVNFMLTDSVT